MDPVVGISTKPLGTFYALSVRDAASLNRDGHPVFAVRHLDDSTVEVLFGDGIWMLAAPGDITPPGVS